MDDCKLRTKFSNIRVWKSKGERAPHKPFLILYALGRLQRKEERMVLYTEAKEVLKALLQDFGPPRLTRPMYPFIYLSNDGIWELQGKGAIDTKGYYSEKELSDRKIKGGFTKEVYALLLQNPILITDIAQDLLAQNFPDLMHEDILNMVGLQIQFSKTKRNPEFRRRILQAYEYSCAVCGFSVWLGKIPVSLEAAHFKWRQAGGPDTEDNGIALCTMHHKLFNHGAFTVTPSLQIQVSEFAHGKRGFDEWLLKFHGNNLRLPLKRHYKPKDTYINWHVREVFKGPGLYMSGTDC
jgi:putative restriction endonuclease